MAINDAFEEYNEENHGFGCVGPVYIKRNITADSLHKSMMVIGFKEHEIKYIDEYKKSANIDIREASSELGIGSQDRIAASIALFRGLPWLSSTKAKYLNLKHLLKYHLPSRNEDVMPNCIPLYEKDGKIIYIISDYDVIPDVKMNLNERGMKNEIYFVFTSKGNLEMLFRREILNTEEKVLKLVRNNNMEDSNELLSAILIHAAYHGASDIHATPLNCGGLIELRIDGVKNFFLSLNKGFYDNVIGVIINALGNPNYTMSVEGRLPSNNIPPHLRNRFEFRIEVMKAVYGSAMTIRLFNLNSETNDVETLGFDEKSLNTIKRMVKSGSGMIMAVGPTGSGKTTTLYASMKLIDATKSSIQSVENPVENRVGIWRQHQLIHEADKTEFEEWSEWNKGLLRTDPDVVLQGEVRDGKLLGVTLDMANTGHLVFTTLHADSAPLAIARVKQMRNSDGSPIDLGMFASLTIGIVAQRLLRRLCNCCKIEEDNEEVKLLLEKYDFKFDKIYKANDLGCPECNHSGYKGRILIYEILEFNRKLIDMITDPKTKISDIEDSMPKQETMLGRSLFHISKGNTDIEEVYRTLKI